VRNLLETRRLHVELRRRERLLDEHAKRTARRPTTREREAERSCTEDDLPAPSSPLSPGATPRPMESELARLCSVMARP
jgi:hypothetical protein